MKTHIPLSLALALIALLLVSLTACSSGVSQEEFDAVNAQLENVNTQLETERARTAELESQVREAGELENRLKRAAHLEAARGLLAGGWGFSGSQVLAFLAAVQDSGDPELKEGMGDLLQGFISNIESLPPDLIGQTLAAVQGAGDLNVADSVQALLFAVAQGGGGPELLAVAQAVHAADSDPLDQVISSILSEVLGQQGAAELAQSISDLASTSTDPAVQQTLQDLSEPSGDFIQQVQEHLDAAGIPELRDAFPGDYLPPSGNPSAFYNNLVEHIGRTLELPSN